MIQGGRYVKGRVKGEREQRASVVPAKGVQCSIEVRHVGRVGVNIARLLVRRVALVCTATERRMSSLIRPLGYATVCECGCRLR